MATLPFGPDEMSTRLRAARAAGCVPPCLWVKAGRSEPMHIYDAMHRLERDLGQAMSPFLGLMAAEPDALIVLEMDEGIRLWPLRGGQVSLLGEVPSFTINRLRRR